MATEYFHNYEFQTTFSGYSLVTTDDRGYIVEAALPFQKHIGESIDDMVKHYRDRKSFVDMRDLGKTKNGILQAQLNSI